MSKVDGLIQELCPGGVEYASLGEAESAGLITMGRGKVISKKALEATPGDYPVYSSSAAGTGEFGRYGDFMFDDERITWSIDGGGKFFYRPEHRYSVTNVSGWMTSDSSVLSLKFLYQSLLSQWAREEFDYTRKAHPSVIREVYTIPLPPLEVQEEIVRILDQFVELDRETEEEIVGREKQFAIALESMSDFPDAPISLIADVCSRVCSGGTPSSKVEKYYGGDIPWVRTQDVQMKVIHEASATITEAGLEASSAKWIKANSVIVAMYGATAAKVALTTIPVTTNQACCNLEIDPGVADFRFVYYWLMRSYENLKALGEGSQSNINSAKVKSFPIPLPPLEVQEEIAAKLDKFTEYIDNLKRERELRQKQYEYYRDWLLDFEVKE
ncbi:restriction endonuclease subunit S [Corynebacterium tuberculostearicum]|uniref:restriction endonuclease subunit S n=1 Tax=Corynebacterium tuberculostearicum TaxID=38304 RepID=UPI0038D0AFB0